ncbi:putative metalloprotease [Russula earlei]|uniref:Metalloprotease n=1 Tax=Russula earlei TaxID=71964 RepID=A0ACC0TWZ5_9AGAM|nr:putative metalloprotease [Russula earlei]
MNKKEETYYERKRTTQHNDTCTRVIPWPAGWTHLTYIKVWAAEMLWVVAQQPIAKHSFTESLFPPAPLKRWHNLLRRLTFIATSLNLCQLVLNATKIQPSRPGFFKARSAIIESDRILTGGKNFCELWLGFAEKGLGGDAEVVNRTP